MRGAAALVIQLSWDAYANSLSEIRREHETEAVLEPLPFAPARPVDRFPCAGFALHRTGMPRTAGRLG